MLRGSGGDCASSPQARLREAEQQLLEQRREADSKDRLIQQHTDSLVRSVGLRTQEANERDELLHELVEARASHERELAEQRGGFEAEHAEAVQRQAWLLDGQVEAMLAADAAEGGGLLGLSAEGVEFPDARAEAAHEARRRGEQETAAALGEELGAVRAEHQRATIERNNEVEAASVTREAFLAEKRANQRHAEALHAQVRAKVSETEALQDAHRALESKTRSLQHELGNVAFTVGQRDQELKVKEDELHEVRRSIACIQDEMDDVNTELKEQCGRVERVEENLRLSRDLGERVRMMREMVKESHDSLGQLCGLLEKERSRREQCSQGLRQQGLRTELLLQLLHHFKTRTQDLSPQVVLAQVGGAGRLSGGVATGGSERGPLGSPGGSCSPCTTAGVATSLAATLGAAGFNFASAASSAATLGILEPFAAEPTAGTPGRANGVFFASPCASRR